LNDKIDAENLDSAEYQAWMNEFQQWQEALADYAPAALLDNMMKDEHFLAFQRDFEVFQAEFKQFQQELQKEIPERASQMADGDERPPRKSSNDATVFEPPVETATNPGSNESLQPVNNDDTITNNSPFQFNPSEGERDNNASSNGEPLPQMNDRQVTESEDSDYRIDTLEQFQKECEREVSKLA
jgi:hypothetical protein